MKNNSCSNDLDWSNRRFLIEVTRAEAAIWRNQLKANLNDDEQLQLIPQKQQMGGQILAKWPRFSRWKSSQFQQQTPWREIQQFQQKCGSPEPKPVSQLRYEGWVSFLPLNNRIQKQNCTWVKEPVEFTCINAEKIGEFSSIGLFLKKKSTNQNSVLKLIPKPPSSKFKPRTKLNCSHLFYLSNKSSAVRYRTPTGDREINLLIEESAGGDVRWERKRTGGKIFFFFFFWDLIWEAKVGQDYRN